MSTMFKASFNTGETWIFDPQLDENGAAHPQTGGRKIRLYSSVDKRLMFSDFFAKLQINFPR